MLRPSTEALWDGALARGLHVFGTVTDDAHHYDDAARVRASGERPFVGDLGFVVVHAEKNLPSIRSAIERGDFYGSTGIVFDTYVRTATSLSLVTHESPGGGAVDFEAIANGAVVERQHGTRFEVTLAPAHGAYVRVRATRADGAFAWPQPLFAAPPK